MTFISTILEWLFYGAVRYVLLWVPLVTPFRVDRSIPSPWWKYNGYGDWMHRDDNNGGPDEHWLQAWFRMAVGEFKLLVLDEAKPYVDAAKRALQTLVGYIRAGFPSMGGWVNWLQGAVGYVTPFFASNLGAAAVWLYDRFPAGIRQGWQSWSGLWENIKASVRSWARSQYDQAKVWAGNNLGWISGIGESLRWWRDRVAGWIDNVRGNPRGWIVGVLGSGIDWLLAFALSPVSLVLSWLGPEWPKLQTFARDCVPFFYNLWSAGWRTLSEFVRDPLHFMISRLEQAVMDRW